MTAPLILSQETVSPVTQKPPAKAHTFSGFLVLSVPNVHTEHYSFMLRMIS